MQAWRGSKKTTKQADFVKGWVVMTINHFKFVDVCRYLLTKKKQIMYVHCHRRKNLYHVSNDEYCEKEGAETSDAGWTKRPPKKPEVVLCG